MALKSISLPDVTKIGMNALSYCMYLQEICAPNVSAIDEYAFGECYDLRKVTFGELTDVKGYDMEGIFADINTDIIDLELSVEQKRMTKELIDGRYCWTPTEEPYMGSPDYANKSFLEMKFWSVRCWFND